MGKMGKKVLPKTQMSGWSESQFIEATDKLKSEVKEIGDVGENTYGGYHRVINGTSYSGSYITSIFKQLVRDKDERDENIKILKDHGIEITNISDKYASRETSLSNFTVKFKIIGAKKSDKKVGSGELTTAEKLQIKESKKIAGMTGKSIKTTSGAGKTYLI